MSSLLVFAVVGSVGLGGCSSDPERGSGTLCEVVKATAKSCTDPEPCDGVLGAQCATLDKALSAATVTALRNCLESGVCGISTCVSQAPRNTTPTAGHVALADAFCTSCAAGLEDCKDLFYAPRGKLPGILVLPFSESIARAVTSACTANRETCRAEFATCATDTIARLVGEAIPADAAECVVSGLRTDGPDGAGPGGGPLVSVCNASNCTGCCRDGLCIETDDNISCGLGGVACETCSGLQRCLDGACKEPCGPNNCPGCCDGEACLGGTERDKCGENGAACAKCSTQGATFVCSNKQCIDGSCQATCASGCCSATGCKPGTAANACGTGGEGCIDCGVGRTCSATTRTCALDPNSTWDFFVSSAKIPPRTKSDSSWDLFGGSADPYLVAFSSQGAVSHTAQTRVLADTHTPAWGESPLKAIRASEFLTNLSFEIWDNDDFDYDDPIGGCRIGITAASFDQALRVVTCPPTASAGQIELFFRLVKSR